MKHLLTLFFALSVFYAKAQCDDYVVYIEDDTLSNHVLCANNQNEATIQLRIDTTVSPTIGASNYYIVRTQFPDGSIRRDSTRKLNHYIWTMQPGVHTVLNVEDDQGCMTDLNEEVDIKYVPEQRAILTSTGDFCAGDDHAVVTVEIFPKTDVEMTYYGYFYHTTYSSIIYEFDITGSKDTFHVDQPGEYALDYYIKSSQCIFPVDTALSRTNIKGTFCYDLEVIHPSCDDDDGGFRITNTDQTNTFKAEMDGISFGEDTIEVTNFSSGKYTIDLQSTGSGGYESIEIDLRKGGLEYIISEEMPSCEEGNGSISIEGLSVAEEDIIWSNGETGSSIDNLYPGLYELVVMDNADMCHDTTQILLQDSCSEQNFATITGKVFNDVNGNGYKGTGEEYLASKYVYVTPGNYYGYTNQQGEYSIKVPLGLDYELHISPGYKYSCSGRYYRPAEVSFPVDGNYEGIDLTVKGQQIDKDFGLIVEEECMTISGFVFDDEDANGTQDAGEMGMRGARLLISNEDYNFSTFVLSGDDGHFTTEVPVSDSDYILTFSPTNNQYYFCSQTYIDQQTFPLNNEGYTYSDTENIVFGVGRESAFDVAVVAINPYNGYTPGEVFHAWMDFKANGDIDEDCSLRLTFDDHVTFVSDNLKPDVITDTYIQWDFDQYSIPGAYCNRMQFRLDEETPAAYNLVYTAEYSCENEDACPNNNIISRSVVTSGPATLRKAEATTGTHVDIKAFGRGAEGAITESDTVLSYEINFNNVGRDTLYHLTIRDTLPDNLQFGKVSKAFSSEAYEFSFIEPNILQWEFPNLNMPGSYKNKLESYGFLQFNIITTPLNLGDMVEKEISVTFNENATVKASSVMNVSKLLSLDEEFAESRNVSVYPNPSNGKVTVKSQRNMISEVVVSDITGMEVKRFSKINANQTDLSLHGLQSGVYLIQVYAETSMETYKVVVQ